MSMPRCPMPSQTNHSRNCMSTMPFGRICYGLSITLADSQVLQKVPEFEFTSRPTLRVNWLVRLVDYITSAQACVPILFNLNIVVQISMTTEDLLDLANLRPDILNGESLTKIFFFFTYLPQFKNSKVPTALAIITLLFLKVGFFFCGILE